MDVYLPNRLVLVSSLTHWSYSRREVTRGAHERVRDREPGEGAERHARRERENKRVAEGREAQTGRKRREAQKEKTGPTGQTEKRRKRSEVAQMAQTERRRNDS